MSCLKAIIDVLSYRDYSDEMTNKEHHPLIAISEQTRKLNRSSRRSLDATRGLLSCGSSFTNSTPIISSTSGSGSLSSFGCVAHDPGHNALLVNRFSNDVGFSSSLWTGGSSSWSSSSLLRRSCTWLRTLRIFGFSFTGTGSDMDRWSCSWSSLIHIRRKSSHSPWSSRR